MNHTVSNRGIHTYNMAKQLLFFMRKMIFFGTIVFRGDLYLGQTHIVDCKHNLSAHFMNPIWVSFQSAEMPLIWF
jgi:hypothetical protein